MRMVVDDWILALKKPSANLKYSVCNNTLSRTKYPERRFYLVYISDPAHQLRYRVKRELMVISVLTLSVG